MNDRLKLYGYWRSSAAYRVRIALNLKGLAYDCVPVHLVRDGGEQHRPEYAATNQQRLVPVLQHGQRMIRQSLAIIEYLDELWPDPPLLPGAPRERARAVIDHCVHPSYRAALNDYFERACAKGGHTPHLLREAMQWHIDLEETGSMIGGVLGVAASA